MAFHPRYARNRLFYVNYTDTSGDTRVVEYRSRGLTPRAEADAPDSLRRPAVLEPQRRPDRIRSRRLPLCRDGRWRLRRRPAESGSEPSLAARQASAAQRQHSPPEAGDRRLRPAQPVALLVRPADRRPLHRRCRPGHPGGARLHSAQEPRPGELRLACLRGQAAVLERDAELAREARDAVRRPPEPAELLGDRRLRLPRQRGPVCEGPLLLQRQLRQPCSERGRQGRDVRSETSRSAWTGAPRSARTPAASSTSCR